MRRTAMNASPTKSGTFRLARWLTVFAPVLAAGACFFVGIGVDRLHLGPPWQFLVLLLLGPLALAGGIATAEFVAPKGSLLYHYMFLVWQTLAVLVVQSLLFRTFVTSWQ